MTTIPVSLMVVLSTMTLLSPSTLRAQPSAAASPVDVAAAVQALGGSVETERQGGADQIVRISITKDTVRDADLTFLQATPRLRHLTLWCPRITDQLALARTWAVRPSRSRARRRPGR